jgi:hypothetical protein
LLGERPNDLAQRGHVFFTYSEELWLDGRRENVVRLCVTFEA